MPDATHSPIVLDCPVATDAPAAVDVEQQVLDWIWDAAAAIDAYRTRNGVAASPEDHLAAANIQFAIDAAQAALDLLDPPDVSYYVTPYAPAS